MSDTPATPAKAVKATAAKVTKAFESPFEAFSFSVPSNEVPAAFRDFAEKALSGSKEAYAKIKTAAEEATEAFEDSVETARSGALEFSHKSLDAAKTNTDATFAYFRDILTVKTFAEALELQTSFAKKQAEVLAAQFKDFQELSQKFATEASRPLKASYDKAVKSAKIN
ncbi:phasin [Kaistia algarum]|uniref:phasin n=1 Tax=Kaistia algarum TaxID=2083279 RepID=UPI000CE7CC89|nr:phasin [Kaistia algarum]MCX5512536.1 phasin [Kaistia algarum]PPE81936.1 phasin [Kaistia algarum]